MAKKAKRAKRVRAKDDKVTPTYLARGESFRMGLHDVVKALKVIERHGHLNKLVSRSKRDSKPVDVPAETVNFVKDFMVKHKMHNDRVGKHIVNARVARPAATGMALRDRFSGCDFGNG
jgi:hypothetical protein